MVKEGTKHADTSRVTGWSVVIVRRFKSRFRNLPISVSWWALQGACCPMGRTFPWNPGFFRARPVGLVIDFLFGPIGLFFVALMALGVHLSVRRHCDQRQRDRRDREGLRHLCPLPFCRHTYRDPIMTNKGCRGGTR